MLNAVLSLTLLAAGQAEKKEVKWLTSYKDAAALALKEGKPLVIDAGREA